MKVHAERWHRGFTLMEIMVTTIILAIVLTMSVTQYGRRKRLSAYKAAIPAVQSIAAAEKNYYLTWQRYRIVSGTDNLNSALSTRVIDSPDFFNYQTVANGASFNVRMSSREGSLFTFDSNGTRLSCSGGSDCWVY